MILKIVNKIIIRPYLKFRLKKLSKNIKLGVNITIGPFNMIDIGDNFFCGENCRITTSKIAKIDIGSNVMFGPEVKIISGNHNMSYSKKHMMFAPSNGNDRGCFIEDGAWIGAGAIILDGSTVGEGAVIGAGSVVRGYVPPYTVWIGNPAKFYKHRFNCENLEVMLKSVNSKYSINSLKDLYSKNKCVNNL